MTQTINIRGTSELQFRIGVTGPTVYQGDGDPSGLVPLDTLRNGDLYIRTGTGSQGLFVYDATGFAWNQLTSSGGSQTFSGNVTVEGEFDTHDNIMDINNDEAGSGISAPGGRAGVSVNRGTQDTVQWVFDETNDWWQPVSSQSDANSVYVPYNLVVGTAGATFDAGLVGLPAMHFSGDTDTGIYSPSPGFIGFSNNGSLSWAIGSGGELIPYGIPDIGNATNRVGSLYTTRTLHSDGNASNPSVSFYSDPNTGMYSGGPDNISFAINGTQRFQINSNGRLSTFSGYEGLVVSDDTIPNKKYVDDAIATATLAFPILANPAGTPAMPAYSFLGQSNTGMFLNGADLSFSNGALTRLSIKPNGVLEVNTTNYETIATAPDDIPNRQLVQNLIAGISWKEPVKVRDNTLHINLAAAEASMNGGTVDGVAVVNGDRILYTNITGSPDDVYRINGNPGAAATLIQEVSSPGTVVQILNGTFAGITYFINTSFVWNGFGGLNNVDEDPSPSLGGDLDVNDYDIVGKPPATPTSVGGTIDILASSGGASGGIGGDVNIYAGNAQGGNTNGGAVLIKGGDPAGSGSGGNITLTPGTSGGNIITTSGQFLIQDGTTANPGLAFASLNDTGLALLTGSKVAIVRSSQTQVEFTGASAQFTFGAVQGINITNNGLICNPNANLRVQGGGCALGDNMPYVELINSGGHAKLKGADGPVAVFPGGDVILEGGDGGSTSGDGGDIFITPGTATSGSDGAVVIAQTSPPTSTTNKLYNDSGNLYWDGTQLNVAASITQASFHAYSTVPQTTPLPGPGQWIPLVFGAASFNTAGFQTTVTIGAFPASIFAPLVAGKYAITLRTAVQTGSGFVIPPPADIRFRVEQYIFTGSWGGGSLIRTSQFPYAASPAATGQYQTIEMNTVVSLNVNQGVTFEVFVPTAGWPGALTFESGFSGTEFSGHYMSP